MTNIEWTVIGVMVGIILTPLVMLWHSNNLNRAYWKRQFAVPSSAAKWEQLASERRSQYEHMYAIEDAVKSEPIDMNALSDQAKRAMIDAYVYNGYWLSLATAGVVPAEGVVMTYRQSGGQRTLFQLNDFDNPAAYFRAKQAAYAFCDALEDRKQEIFGRLVAEWKS